MSEHNDSLRETVRKQSEILSAIADQSRAKHALTDTLDVSRSTVNRGVAELEQEDCIERRGSNYHATILGELALKNYQEYRSNIEELNKASELLTDLPKSASINTIFIRDADIRISNPRAPEAVLQPSIDLLENTDRLLGLAPVGFSKYIRLINKYADINNISVDIIVEKGTLQSILYLDKKQIKKLVSEGNLNIFVVDEPLYYALWLMDSPEGTTAGITFYGNGGINGIIINSSSEAVSWARGEYERYHELAERMTINNISNK